MMPGVHIILKATTTDLLTVLVTLIICLFLRTIYVMCFIEGYNDDVILTVKEIYRQKKNIPSLEFGSRYFGYRFSEGLNGVVAFTVNG